MLIVKIIFWLCLGLVFYTYVGYGFLLAIFNWLRKRPDSFKQEVSSFEPEVTLIVAAYNEETCIRQKIQNCLELDYPKEKLKLLFITDGSTDHSPNIIREYRQIKLLHLSERNGKTAALNRAMQQVQSPVAVFCDANTILNREAIKMIVRHYSDPRTGGVAGEKRIMVRGDDGISGQGEGLYWKYESWLKKQDSDFHSVVGAAGELFSVKTELYEPVEKKVILDDFIISMRVALKGYRVVYEPKALAMELPSDNIQEEQKRKIRISAGAFQAMKMLGSAFNLARTPLLSFQFISHRVFRWAIAPLCLLIVLISNILLTFNHQGNLYAFFLFLQISFYFFALLGYWFSLRNKKTPLFYVPYYFTFMNLSVYKGYRRYCTGEQTALWEKAKRKTFILQN